jgi:beta-galactosidase
MDNLHITPQGFQFNGQTVQLISGALHYFRIVPEYWENRLLQLKACGADTLETYVPWNAHEPQPGVFDFDGILDIVRFIQIAGEVGLRVIVRPSPYICAEWEFGGLPAWLLRDPGMRIRCQYTPYLNAVSRYYDRLLTLLAPLQTTQGGPIIAMQIENEYGSYGNDHGYLTFLEEAMRARGIDVPLFTSDGPNDAMLQGGTLPHILKTANFGSRGPESFAKLREYQKDGPLMCAEFWNGWFDHWEKPHHTRDAADAARCLDEMLAMGASVNFYMFHGGTNFGFMSGANYDKDGGRGYEPTVTSYDYDAPVSESGDLTPKYYAFRDVIAKYRPNVSLPTAPEPAPKIAPGTVALTEYAPLFASLAALSPSPQKRNSPEPMENLGQNAGSILYRTRLSGPRPAEKLFIQEVRDRALIFLDGKFLGIRYRNDNNQPPITVTVPAEGATLDILVENMGRVNYGPFMLDRKGITEGVRLSNQFQYDWEIFPLPLEAKDLDALTYQSVAATTAPAFYRGTFTLDEIGDTFVALSASGWTKGICWINGFNLGRYWNVEPQRNLYIPGPLLRQGENEIVLFEFHGNTNEAPILELTNTP